MATSKDKLVLDVPDGYYVFDIVYQHTLPPWFIQTEKVIAKNSKDAESVWKHNHPHQISSHELYLISITINTAQKQ